MSIVLLGESIKAGFLIYLFLFSHLMDRWGRRAVMVRGLAIQSCLLIALICCPGGSPWAQYLMYFLMISYSIVYHLVYYAAWIYFLELMPQKYHNGTIIVGSVGSSVTIVFGSLFFMEVSQD